VFFRRTRRVVVGLLSATVLVGVTALSACTSSDVASGAKITLGFSAWPGWFPWQVAQEQGLFEQNGVDVELKWFDSYTDSINALSSGAIDANSQTLNDTLSAVSGGARLRVVLTNDNSTGNDKIIAREGINSVAELKGKKVAVEEGTVDHYLLLLALEGANLAQDDIELVPMLTDAAAAAFVGGQVDAVGAFAPFTTTALARPGSRAVASSAEFPGAIPDHLVVSDALVDDRPEDVQKLVDAWFDTIAWIRDNEDDALKIMAERAGVSVAEYKSYDAGTTIFTRQQNMDAFTAGTTPKNLNFQADEIADFITSTGLAKDRPEVGDLFVDTFVNAATE
jgi:NitT/TauT family transport system substrate-binding protein